MDIFIPIIICVIFFILFSFCGYCCKRKREGTVYGPGTNVTITTQPVTASPVVVPPYPVEPRHPVPHGGAPVPGFAPHMPYPPQGAAPYPPTVHPPYPPGPVGGSAPYPDYTGQPPSYAEAVSQAPVQPPPPVKEVYSKQSPYNPNY